MDNGSLCENGACSGVGAGRLQSSLGSQSKHGSQRTLYTLVRSSRMLRSCCRAEEVGFPSSRDQFPPRCFLDAILFLDTDSGPL